MVHGYLPNVSLVLTITMENPVTYIHPSSNQILNHRMVIQARPETWYKVDIVFIIHATMRVSKIYGYVPNISLVLAKTLKMQSSSQIL